ncbi:MAG: hypothetical protein AABX51_09050 [Nanoarchaeota archaeon]
MNSGIDEITDVQSYKAKLPTHLAVTLERRTDDEAHPGSWYHGLYSPWQINGGKSDGQVIWNFGEEFDKKLIFAPEYFQADTWVYQRTKDEFRDVLGIPEFQFRELEYVRVHG